MENKTAIQKALDTVNSINDELTNMPTYDARKLNEVENHIRVELQVMEALVNHLGREVYQHVQTRRQQLRSENNQWVQDVTNPAEDRIKEVLGGNNGNTGTNRDTGDGDGSDKPSRPKRKGNPKARKSA